ncbi:actin-3-like [Microcaecilia unicolor]|uniref:Actin-3-like n=1 Tax=Microcaecilia unicolor TaxID=1415580 RepID=A0A6P7X7P1_9AMPH|nr:actin-3-like [Microcaecilia unicolor]
MMRPGGGISTMEKPSIVMDNGAGYSKAGFCSEDRPKFVLRTKVGIPWSELVHEIGHQTLTAGMMAPVSTSLIWKTPIVHGVVVDWNAIEIFWKHIFYRLLKIDPRAHSVLLSDSPASPLVNRELAAELLFESFGVPAMHIAPSCTLSMYSCGRTIGLVIDVGDGTSLTCPILEGYILPCALYRLDIAGETLTHRMRELLRLSGNSFFSHQKSLVRKIKEKTCYVALDYQKELQSDLCLDYPLPDGHILSLTKERFQCPETLLQPKLMGINEPGLHQMAFNSLQKVESSSQQAIQESILLCGGSSLFRGLPERLLNELRRLLTGNSKFNLLVPNPKKRWYAAWVGGAIAASLPTFNSLWVTKEEYKENGPISLHRKCN